MADEVRRGHARDHGAVGGQVTVYYAAPMHQFSRGAIGYEKQKRPGRLGFGVMLGAVALIVLALIVLPNL